MEQAGEAKRSHEKEDDTAAKWPRNSPCEPQGEAGPTLETGQEGLRASPRGRGEWEISRMGVPGPRSVSGKCVFQVSITAGGSGYLDGGKSKPSFKGCNSRRLIGSKCNNHP